MPVSQSAKKALRKDRRRTSVNQKIRREFKLALKKARTNPNLKNLTQAGQALDRAAKKRVIHPNKAARLKSRLTHLAKSTKKKSSPGKKKTSKRT